MSRWTGTVRHGRDWRRYDVIADDPAAARQAIADAAAADGCTVVTVHDMARVLAVYHDGEVS